MSVPAALPSTSSTIHILSLATALAAVITGPAASAPADEVLRWQAMVGGRHADLSVPQNGRAGFTTILGIATGIHFTNVLTLERGLTNQIFMSGSGVAFGDVDNDGLVDVYLCGLDCPNRLYRNLGNWKFADVTTPAVACAEGASTGAVFADVDADRDLALLVTGLGRGVRLFQNNGRNRFAEVTDQAGLRSTAGSRRESSFRV